MNKVISLVLAVSLTVGCSAFRPHQERISVMTNQPDAKIFVNGNQIGQGMVNTKVKRNKDVQIMASKPGYQTAYRQIDSNLNITGILDIVGIFFFIWPFIGLLTPGSKSLDETNVALNLDPITPVPAQK